MSGERRFRWLGVARWLRRMRGEKWRVLVALLAAFTALALGVAGAVSGVEVGLLWLPVLPGVLLGWVLGASPAGAPVAVLVAALSGPLLIAVQVGNLGRPLLAVAEAALRLVRQAVVLRAWPTAAPVVAEWSEVTGAAGTLVGRVVTWALALAQGEPVFDPVATAVLWLAALWVAAVWAGWTVRRRNRPVRALLPAMMLLGGAVTVSGGSALTLIPAVGLALVLRAGAAHEAREAGWRRQDVGFSSRYGRDVRWAAAGLALGLMVVALVVPSLSIYRVLEVARDLAEQERGQEVARSLGLDPPERAAPADVFLEQRRGGLPTRHLIGSGPELSEEPVMAITVEQPAAVAGRLRYWRGVTYDTYTGRGWETASTTTVAYEAGETAGAVVEGQTPVRLAVRRLREGGDLLYTAGTPVTVDGDFQIAWRARYPDAGIFTDFFAASLAGAAPGGDAAGPASYRVDARVPLFGETELRDVAWAISPYIADRYLALPDGVSGRVRALARDLTVTEPTPYDRALAIEDHLRQFPYTLDLPAPPADREIADYFLFDLQRGYCDYYATTMVVLARAAGLPARLATGYVGGTFDEEANATIVTADLAHAWPELYFPGHGWIPFEPTAGRAVLERPEEEAAEIGEEAALEPITAARVRAFWGRALRIGGGVLLAAAAVLLGRWLLHLWRLRSLPPDRALRRLFANVQRGGRRMEVVPEVGETAHEFAGRLNARLLVMTAGRGGGRSLASAPEAVDWLTDVYARSQFSPDAPRPEQQGRAVACWLRLQIQLWWAAVLWRGRRVGGRSR